MTVCDQISHRFTGVITPFEQFIGSAHDADDFAICRPDGVTLIERMRSATRNYRIATLAALACI
jgi:hypothetical protein